MKGVIKMREILINKNICLMFWLRRCIGRKKAKKICLGAEKAILFFGRPRYNGTA